MLTGKSTCCALRPPDTLLLTVTKTRSGSKEHENELVQIERNCKENLSNALHCKNSPQCVAFNDTGFDLMFKGFEL